MNTPCLRWTHACIYFLQVFLIFFKKWDHLRCKLKPWNWQLSGTYFVVFARQCNFCVTQLQLTPALKWYGTLAISCLAKSGIFEIYLCWQHGSIAVHAFSGWIFGSLPSAKDAVILLPDESPACMWATLGTTWTWGLTAEYVSLPL